MKIKKINSFVIQRSRYPALCFPNFFNMIKLTTKEFEDEFGCKLSYTAVLFRNNKRMFFIGEQEDLNKLRDTFLRKILENKEFVIKQYKLFNENKIKLLKFVRKYLRREKLNKLDNKNLSRLLSDYYKKYEDFTITIAPFMHFVIDLFEEEIKRRIKTEHSILLKSPDFSYSISYELDYFMECNKVSKKLNKKWGWIPFDYLGPDEWDRKYFLSRMNVDYKKMNEIKQNNLTLIKNQRKVLKNYSPLIKRFLNDFHTLSKMQDDRKGVTTLTHVYLQKYLFGEISKRIGVKKRYLSILTPEEVRNTLVFNRKFKESKLNKRLTNSLILFSNNKFTFHYKDKIYNRFVSLLPLNKEIKGNIACQGIVRGVVKVCLTSEDFPKVKEGDILVAPMTTPDYVIAMGKAAGFITDEGGITCHAAIVSREMNKPCIVGTNSATDLLKDGDYIELDANEGVIKKIERKRSK